MLFCTLKITQRFLLAIAGAIFSILYRPSKHFKWFGKRNVYSIKGAVLKQKCKTLYCSLNQEKHHETISSKNLICEKNNSTELLRETIDCLDHFRYFNEPKCALIFVKQLRGDT